MRVLRYRFWLGVLAWLGTISFTPGQEVSSTITYSGMCDASAAVALSPALFAVANDEDNLIRLYSTKTNGPPVSSVDLARYLHVQKEKKPETDFEGAAWLGERIFWITSHGRNREGKFRPSRHRFFATRWNTNGSPALLPVGNPYAALLRDLTRDPKLKRFNLARAATLSPKEPGAFNIEGLAATPDNHLLIGFRNPVPNDRALIVPLLNPHDLIAGIPAQFGNPILLDLGGLGIRDMALVRGEYLIVAGPYHGGGDPRLYRWAGGSAQPEPIAAAELADINPEAIVSYPGDAERVQLLSDDGTRKIQGVDCKKLPAALRRFRAVWVGLNAPKR